MSLIEDCSGHSGRESEIVNWWHSGAASCSAARVNLCGHCLENNPCRNWRVAWWGSLQSPNSQLFSAVSKQGHVDAAHNTSFPRKQGSVQQCTELQSNGPPGDEWFICWEGLIQAANGAGCTAAEDKGSRGVTTDRNRKLKQEETLTSFYFIMSG